MSLEQLTKAELLSAVGDSVSDEVLRRCRDAFEADPRATFNVGTAPANVLLRSLTRKCQIARERGRTVLGDRELFAALEVLGGADVSGVVTHEGAEHFMLYLHVDPLRPIAGLIVVP